MREGKRERQGEWEEEGESPGKLDKPLEMSHRTLFSFDHEEAEVDKDPWAFPLRFLNSQTISTSVHLCPAHPHLHPNSSENIQTV